MFDPTTRTDTSAEPVAAGVWLIRLPLPWPPGTVNVFLLKSGDGYLLLDTGLKTQESLAALGEALAQLGAGWTDVRRILISHMHADHCGAVPQIRELSGAPVWMHPVEAKLVAPRKEGDRFFTTAEVYLRRHGVPESTVDDLRKSSQETSQTASRFIPDFELHDGDRIEYDEGALEVLLTPGHSPALLSFYAPEPRILFSTDVILEKITPNIGLHPFSEGDPLGDYHASLARLERIEIDLLLPCHGRPFRGHRAWIASAREHHRRRSEKILATLQDGPRDAWSVAGELWGRERSMIEQRFALAEGLAHLEHLAREGRVKPIQTDGVIYWQAKAAAW